MDLGLDEPSFDHSTFSRNRAWLLEHEVAGEFFRVVVQQARSMNPLSDEHFTVDGTLAEAWASRSPRKGDHQSGGCQALAGVARGRGRGDWENPKAPRMLLVLAMEIKKQLGGANAE